MKSAFVPRFLPTFVAAAGLAFASSAFSPANAYGVVDTGTKPDNASGYLHEVSLKGGTVSEGGDVGRRLDPVKWLVPANGTKPGVDLTATASITVQNFTSNLLSLAITLSNTTAGNFQAAVVGLGLGIDPDASSANVIQNRTTGEQNVFDQVRVDPNGTFPGGFKKVDVCVYAANNCQGGNINEGLQSGGKIDTFLLNISGNFGTTPSATLNNFAIKFQTQNGSYEAAGVPEPITVIGSGLALGFGVLFKRELSKKRNKAEIKS